MPLFRTGVHAAIKLVCLYFNSCSPKCCCWWFILFIKSLSKCFYQAFIQKQIKLSNQWTMKIYISQNTLASVTIINLITQQAMVGALLCIITGL